MPPKRAATAKASKAEDMEPAVNGTAGRGRPKKSATPAANGVAKEPAKGRGRPKKDAAAEPAPAPAPKESGKRKKDDASEGEPEPEPQKKKAKVADAPKGPQPKGPRRMRGQKTIVNTLRYTEPLKVFVFGEGANGELGLGATKKAIDVQRPRFNQTLTNMNVVKVACGGMHVLALTSDNKILTWGVNDNGALGRDTAAGVKVRDMDADDDDDSDSEDETGGLNDLEATPTAVSAEHFPDDTEFVDIAAGDSCSFALTTEGALYGWGTFRKNEGILGFQRDIHTAKYPIWVDSVRKITQIACGTNHVLALDKDSKLYAWGNGQQNQLGRRVTERTLLEALTPNKLGFHDSSVKRPSQKIAQIACGDYHGLAIAEDGHVWSWGANNYCETGHGMNAGDDNASVLSPQIVHALEGKNIKKVDGGSHHSIAIGNGEVYVWGRCDGSQTGIPSSQLQAIDDESKLLKLHGKPKILIEPTAIPNLKDIVTGTCGPEHTIVIDAKGKAYSWGFSANYQTGLGTDDDVELPTMIDNTAVRETKLTYAGAGGQFSILASKKG